MSAVLMFGCLRDDISGNAPGGNASGAAGYIAIKLGATDENKAEAKTRVDINKEYDDNFQHYEWFNKGTKDERAIINREECNRILIFYDNNSFYGSARMQMQKKTDDGTIFLAQQPDVPQGAMEPTKFLVVINGDPTRLDAVEAALQGAGTNAVKTALYYLNEVTSEEDAETTAMCDGYFTMSSSIYMKDAQIIESLDDDEDRLITGVTEKADFRFYDTPEEALRPENLLTIYVERILAKFTVRVQDGEMKFSENVPIIIRGETSVKVREYYQRTESGDKDVVSGWRVNLANWGVNGVEKNTYMFKTLVKEPAGNYPWRIETDFYGYGQRTTAWNEPRLFRSYWAIDENYDTGFYPDQYRQALDRDDDGNMYDIEAATGNNIYSDGYDGELTKNDYTLIYRSYNAFGERLDNKYSVENTFDASVMANKDLTTSPWLRCGTHIIITAQLIIDELDKEVVARPTIDENGFIAGVSDKYFSNGLYWSETALIQNSTATLLSNIYYSDADNGLPNVLSPSKTRENVTLVNYDEYNNPLDEESPIVDENNTPLTVENALDYFELAPAFIKGGDGWVTLHLKDGKKLYANHVSGREAITDEQLVSYIYRFTNLSKHYSEGRMYYALAVKQNLDSKNFERETGAVDTGDYGVVRNHWYRLTVNSVLNPGTPVDDPDQPIIPNPEPDDKSLGVEIEVIPWHVVDIHVDTLQ